MTTIAGSAPADQASVKPFGIRDKIGYMFGDLGNDMTFGLASTFLMVFYTNVLGVSAVTVGTILLSVRLLDSAVDVAIGVAVDRAPQHRAGKFRPWIKRGMIPVAIASFLMYIPFVNQFNEPLKLVYIFVTYLLWSVCYSYVNIPYGSMAASLSPDPADRASLSVFRTLGGQGAMMSLSLVVPLFIYVAVPGQTKQQVDGTRFMIVAAVLSVLAVIWYTIHYNMVTERVVAKPAPEGENVHGIGHMLKGLVSNKALLALIVGALLLLMATMLSGALSAYLWLVYFQNGKLQGVAQMLSVLPILLLLPLATTAAKRFGKKEVSAVGMLFAGLVFLTLFFVRVENGVVYIVGILVAGLGLAWFNTLVWAFIADIIDFQEVKTGTREDGTIYAIYSMARKVGQALAGGLGGWALGWVGYNSALAKSGGTQAPETVQGIYTLSTLVPAACYLLVSLVLFFWYPLSKKAVAQNTAILVERHSQATAAEISEAAESAGAAPKKIITMWELYGSGMEEVAQRLAAEMNLPLHKQAFTSEQIEATQAERENQSAIGRLLLGSGPVAAGPDGSSTNVTTAVKGIGDAAQQNREVVAEEAKAGGIILGRNGAFLLQHVPGALHVKLVAPVADRVARAAREAGIPEERAAKRQVAEDSIRREISMMTYNFDPTGDEYYDLVIDTSKFGVDEAVKMIQRASEQLNS